jgi:hypothetical protein
MKTPAFNNYDLRRAFPNLSLEHKNQVKKASYDNGENTTGYSIDIKSGDTHSFLYTSKDERNEDYTRLMDYLTF